MPTSLQLLATPPGARFQVTRTGRVHRLREATRVSNAEATWISLRFWCNVTSLGDRGQLVRRLAQDALVCERCEAIYHFDRARLPRDGAARR